jgi:dUTP pyrophosphatase
MKLKFKKLTDSAIIPKRSRIGDAAFDISSSEDVLLKANSKHLTHTSIAIEIEDGYCGLVLPRSGNAVNNGITVINTPGLIDSNYRGEIKVGLINTSNVDFNVLKGDRIAQLLIVPVCDVEVVETDELTDSNRGDAGFGSSGR